MIQEEKQLLLKDLSARLPYYTELWSPVAGGNWAILTPVVVSNLMNADLNLPQIKPYLRPMSSMTDEEDEEWRCYKSSIAESSDELLGKKIDELHDWFYRKHIDFRGLIPMGLALEAKEGMYES